MGLLAVTLVGWRRVRVRVGHALRALGLGGGVTMALLAYPAWFGVAGPQAVTGVLFALAPIPGVPFAGLLAPRGLRGTGQRVRPLRRVPRTDGATDGLRGRGVALATVAAVVAGRRLPTDLAALLHDGRDVLAGPGRPIWSSGPAWLGHPWLPWRELARVPVLKEILPDQFVPLVTLFVAFLLALGLDAFYVAYRRPGRGRQRTCARSGGGHLGVAAVALVPVLVTFDLPHQVVAVQMPRTCARGRRRPGRTRWCSPFPSPSRLDAPMLWQAIEGIRFRLAGAALKTPDGRGDRWGGGTGIGPAHPEQPERAQSICADGEAGADGDGPWQPSGRGR